MKEVAYLKIFASIPTYEFCHNYSFKLSYVFLSSHKKSGCPYLKIHVLPQRLSENYYHWVLNCYKFKVQKKKIFLQIKGYGPYHILYYHCIQRFPNWAVLQFFLDVNLDKQGNKSSHNFSQFKVVFTWFLRSDSFHCYGTEYST